MYCLFLQFEKEKRNTVENENALFSRLAGKQRKSMTSMTYSLIEPVALIVRLGDMKEKELELRDILDDDKQYKKTLENCNWCFD
ncbi:unnamed protein product, partial [Allacma fusca]